VGVVANGCSVARWRQDEVEDKGCLCWKNVNWPLGVIFIHSVSVDEQQTERYEEQKHETIVREEWTILCGWPMQTTSRAKISSGSGLLCVIVCVVGRVLIRIQLIEGAA